MPQITWKNDLEFNLGLREGNPHLLDSCLLINIEWSESSREEDEVFSEMHQLVFGHLKLSCEFNERSKIC